MKTVAGFAGGEPLEGSEDPVVQLLGDADARVDDGHLDLVAHRQRDHLDVPVRPVVFDRIADQVDQDLGDAPLVPQHHELVVADCIDEVDLALRREWLHQVARFQIEARTEDDVIELVYRDDGVGVDDETRRQLFEPFFTTTRPRGGTGLGLHLLYLLVTTILGGQVGAKNDDGLELSISIPLRSAP